MQFIIDNANYVNDKKKKVHEEFRNMNMDSHIMTRK